MVRRMKAKKSSSLFEAETFPFHYGGEAEQYTFYRIPKLLFTDPQLKKLTTDAKVLYGLMLDRMSLSLKNGWLDEDGRVFIYFSVEHIMEMIGCGNSKCTRLLQELDSQSGIGLITRVKQGLGKPDVIYVHKCVSRISKSNPQTFQNEISRDVKTKSLDISNQHGINTNINNTESNENNLIYSSRKDGREGMIERENYRKMIQENIGYEYLIMDRISVDRVDEIVELIVDTLCSTQEYIVIGGDKKPTDVVKGQFCKLNIEHIRFILGCLDENTSHVRNIKKYLLSVLYNASMTMGSYYTALVNHNLYGG
jgi:hypothetical protein